MKIRIEKVEGEYQVSFEGNTIVVETKEEAQELALKVLQATGKLGY